MKSYSIGIDIGSTCTKSVVMKNNHIEKKILIPTGWSSVETSEKLKTMLYGYLEDASVVSTGYGRICVPYADKQVTEITCHAKGAVFLFNARNLDVIDIGGQDTKAIRVMDGNVVDFLMNDKCSAGTGKFLEIMANTLGVDIPALCNLAKNGSGVKISSLCTVFAESEVTSLMGRGETKENIAFAVISSIVEKVYSQVSRLLDGGSDVCLTGGLCGCDYLCESLSKAIDKPVLTEPDARFAGAIGAAIIAQNTAEKR